MYIKRSDKHQLQETFPWSDMRFMCFAGHLTQSSSKLQDVRLFFVVTHVMKKKSPIMISQQCLLTLQLGYLLPECIALPIGSTRKKKQLKRGLLGVSREARLHKSLTNDNTTSLSLCTYFFFPCECFIPIDKRNSSLSVVGSLLFVNHQSKPSKGKTCKFSSFFLL